MRTKTKPKRSFADRSDVKLLYANRSFLTERGDKLPYANEVRRNIQDQLAGINRVALVVLAIIVLPVLTPPPPNTPTP